MAGFYGNPIARYVRQGAVQCLTGSWVAVHTGGSGGSELAQRQWIEMQPRARDNIAMALRFVNKNADGTFTTPTSTAHDAIVYPGTSIISKPISDDVRVFARAVQRGGTSGGFKLVVVEYA